MAFLARLVLQALGGPGTCGEVEPLGPLQPSSPHKGVHRPRRVLLTVEVAEEVVFALDLELCPPLLAPFVPDHPSTHRRPTLPTAGCWATALRRTSTFILYLVFAVIILRVDYRPLVLPRLSVFAVPSQRVAFPPLVLPRLSVFAVLPQRAASSPRLCCHAVLAAVTGMVSLRLGRLTLTWAGHALASLHHSLDTTLTALQLAGPAARLRDHDDDGWQLSRASTSCRHSHTDAHC